MRVAGVTNIVTVLSQAEKPDAIGAAARNAGLVWLWIDIGSTKNLPARRQPRIADALRSMAEILRAGGRIYLHCSAGIHRTGMITAALLFHLGFDEHDVKALLTALRPLTATEMGTERFEWAQSFAAEN